MLSFKKPGVILVGPIRSDKKGNLTGEGGKLLKALRKEGFLSIYTSGVIKRIPRAFDIIYKLFTKKSKYSLILLQIFGRRAIPLEAAVSFFSKLFNKKLVLTIHGGAYIEFYNRFPWINRRILKSACKINTPSHFISEFLLNKGYPVDYIPNFIDPERFFFCRKVKNPYSILWVRAFNDIYHPELAILAFEKVVRDFPEARMTMVGPDQGTYARCKMMVRSMRLEKLITFTGRIPNDQLPEYYHTHQIYINTTRYESFGVALVESGACGIPCVSTAVGEIPVIWKDRENILFSERDPEVFAAKITELFMDKELREKISINANANASGFTWENVRNNWLTTIDACVE